MICRRNGTRTPRPTRITLTAAIFSPTSIRRPLRLRFGHEEGCGGEKRGPACHRSSSAEPKTVETVKTCAVLTPSLGQSLERVMARVQEPSNSNLGNCAETFPFQPTVSKHMVFTHEWIEQLARKVIMWGGQLRNTF